MEVPMMLIQHILSRSGDRDDYGNLSIRDAFSVCRHDVVIDHCNFSFAIDEVVKV